jgi:hypothetical protein
MQKPLLQKTVLELWESRGHRLQSNPAHTQRLALHIRLIKTKVVSSDWNFEAGAEHVVHVHLFPI